MLLDKKIKVELLAFGIAKDIVGSNQLTIEIDANSTVGQLKGILFEDYPAFVKLRSLSIAVNEEYRTDDYLLSEQDEIVIIPPVSGG